MGEPVILGAYPAEPSLARLTLKSVCIEISGNIICIRLTKHGTQMETSKDQGLIMVRFVREN